MRILYIISVLCLAVSLQAEVITYEYDGRFEDAELSLTTAIEAQGLKVDHVSYVGDMLSRTAESVGADSLTFDQAKIFQFCSATLSREMMEIDPLNIGFCPYQIFIYQLTGSETSIIGYRRFPEGEMQKVDEFVAKIIGEAIAF